MKKKGQPNELGIFVKTEAPAAAPAAKPAPVIEEAPVVEAVEEDEPKRKKKHKHDESCAEDCDL
jgi:hypothetical protein